MPKIPDVVRPLVERRVVELLEELETLHRVLKDGQTEASPALRPYTRRTPRPGRTMSAAQKKAVSARMKKYWAEKRKG